MTEEDKKERKQRPKRAEKLLTTYEKRRREGEYKKSFGEHWGIISIFLGKYSPLANLGEMGTILAETTCLSENNMDMDKLDTETGNPTVVIPVPRPPPSLPAPMKVQGNQTSAVVTPTVQDLLLVIEQKDQKIEKLESKLKTQEDVNDIFDIIMPQEDVDDIFDTIMQQPQTL